jgi:hypothetical protein
MRSEHVRDAESDNPSTGRRTFMKTAAGVTAGLVAARESTAAPIQPEDAAPARPQGFLLPFADNDYELGKKFVDDPEKLLSDLGLKAEDIVCPPEVHAAVERSQSFSKEVEKVIKDGMSDPIALTKFCKSIASRHFGDDYQVSIQPYGLKFKERVPMSNMGNSAVTITGSFTITYLDFDVDVDS